MPVRPGDNEKNLFTQPHKARCDECSQKQKRSATPQRPSVHRFSAIAFANASQGQLRSINLRFHTGSRSGG